MAAEKRAPKSSGTRRPIAASVFVMMSRSEVPRNRRLAFLSGEIIQPDRCNSRESTMLATPSLSISTPSQSKMTSSIG